VIRIHPVLDHPEVPAWFVAFVLFHEMLHVAIPPEAGTKRRRVHTRRFRAAERAHPDYARAMAWEKTHVRHLIQRVAATF